MTSFGNYRPHERKSHASHLPSAVQHEEFCPHGLPAVRAAVASAVNKRGPRRCRPDPDSNGDQYNCRKRNA